MKKLIYLFLALIIVACGSDDSSEQQNFLQKYNGVTWAEEEVLIEEGAVNTWIVLSPDGYSDGEAGIFDGNIYCGGSFFAWGVDYFGDRYEIIENSPDRLRIQYIESDGDNSYESTSTYTVSNNGIILNEEIIDSDGEYTSTYTRNHSLPCPE